MAIWGPLSMGVTQMRVAEFNNAAVETLENRRMLAANVSVSGDVLTIKGDPAGQIVELFESNLGGERQVVVRLRCKWQWQLLRSGGSLRRQLQGDQHGGGATRAGR